MSDSLFGVPQHYAQLAIMHAEQMVLWNLRDQLAARWGGLWGVEWLPDALTGGGTLIIGYSPGDSDPGEFLVTDELTVHPNMRYQRNPVESLLAELALVAEKLVPPETRDAVLYAEAFEHFVSGLPQLDDPATDRRRKDLERITELEQKVSMLQAWKRDRDRRRR